MSSNKTTHQPDDLGFVDKAVEYIGLARKNFLDKKNEKICVLDIGPGDGYWAAKYSRAADRTVAIDSWKGIYRCYIRKAKKEIEGRDDVLLIKQDAKEGLPVKNERIHVVTNKDSTQSPELLGDIYRALKHGGFYVKTGATNFWDSLGIILEIAEKRPEYFGDGKGQLPLTSIKRAKKRLDPRSHYNEVEGSELHIIEYSLKPDLDPKDIPPEMKMPFSEKELKKALRWNHILGENYDPEKHPEFFEKLKERLETDGEGNYLVINYHCLLIAEKP